MSGKVFLDTAIFIYSVDQSNSSKGSIALQIIKERATEGNGVISFQVVQEFFNVALKCFPVPMTVDDSMAYLSTVFRPFLSVHSSVGLYREALTLRSRYQISWYDSLIVAAAIEADCSILYSEDLQHGARLNGVRIENPFRGA